MKVLHIFCSILFLFSTSFSYSQSEEFVKGEIIIQLKEKNQFDRFISKISISKSVYGLQLKEVLSEDWHIALLTFNENSDAIEVLNVIRGFKEVSAAGFNAYVQQRAVIPNDTHFPKMWGLHNNGTTGGIADADIDAPEAWSITTGGLTSAGDTIVVAVIDGGFDLAHKDINFYKNRGEIPGNSIDDDLNGYIDDVNGWNAYNNNGSISSDTHGTHVAGTIGAKGNNGTGVTGVSWNVKVLPIQGSSTTESTVVKAYNYVLKVRRLYNQTNGLKGAFIVATNASFGVDKGKPANFPLWCGIYDSLGVEGVLSVGATANQNWDIDVEGDVPTACPSPYMISVTNTTKSDTKYSGAAYGKTTIDLGAPGTDIWSTMPGNTYAGGTSGTGTSMATPHVAGAIGLMFAAACPEFISAYKANPTLVLTMKTILLETVDPITDLTNRTVSNGRLNLHKALVAVQELNNCSTVGVSEREAMERTFSINKVYPNPATNWLELEYVIPQSSSIEVSIYDVIGNKVQSIVKNATHYGIHQHKIDLENLTKGVYFISITQGSRSSNRLKVVVL